MPRDIFGALGALVRAEASRTVPKPKTAPPAVSPPGRPASPSSGPPDRAPGAPDAAEAPDAPEAADVPGGGSSDAPVVRARRRPLTALLRTLFRRRRKDRARSADGRHTSAS
ncbi:hypothetical protein AB0G35_05985 [Streptomyces sp. NPDC021749]|uniref:hypothetical protein n=1 Tax=Streptomyces sp. NPDC021749 TaxID=3154905 RepID=UPI0033E7B08D